MKKLRDMFPGNALYDLDNRSLADSVKLGYIAIANVARRIQLPYFYYLSACQFSVVLSFTAWSTFDFSAAAVPVALGLASLAQHVLHIFKLGTQEKMPCITAARIIAFVANNLSNWNWSMGQFVRKAMRASISDSLGHKEPAVPAVIKAGLPFPAFVRLAYFYLRPESLGDWLRGASNSSLWGWGYTGHVETLQSRVSAVPPAVCAARGFLIPLIIS